MLFPLLILILFILFVGSVGIPFQGIIYLDILSRWLTPSINLLNSNSDFDLDEFVKNAIFSVSIAYFGIFIASLFYGPVYSYFNNLNLINLSIQMGPKRIIRDKIINYLYNWSYNRDYINAVYTKILTTGIRRLAELNYFFDKQVIDGITNGVGILNLFVAEILKYVGGGRFFFYLLFYLFYVSIFY